MGQIRQVKDERFITLEPYELVKRHDFLSNGGTYPQPANQSNPPSVTVKEQ